MPYQYSGSSGTGEPNPDSPSGLAAVQVSSSLTSPRGYSNQGRSILQEPLIRLD